MKNPLRLIKIYQQASAVLDVLDQGKRDWDRGTRTFYLTRGWWERLLVALRSLALALPLPTQLQEHLIMKNWKTTLAGVAAILSVITKIVTTGAIDWQTDAPAVMVGIGLIVAKDANVTGGTIRQ
jgi:hypothetical protein